MPVRARLDLSLLTNAGAQSNNSQGGAAYSPGGPGGGSGSGSGRMSFRESRRGAQTSRQAREYDRGRVVLPQLSARGEYAPSRPSHELPLDMLRPADIGVKPVSVFGMSVVKGARDPRGALDGGSGSATGLTPRGSGANLGREADDAAPSSTDGGNTGPALSSDAAAGQESASASGSAAVPPTAAQAQSYLPMPSPRQQAQPVQQQNRPASPLILWRPAVRVKLATDLPDELLVELVHDIDDSDDDEEPLLDEPFPGSEGEHSDRVWKALTEKRRSLMRGPRLPGNLVRGARDAEIAAAARRRARARYGAWYLTPDLWEAEFRCRRDGNDPEVVLPQQMSQLKASWRRRRAANATPPPGADARAQTPAATPGPQAKGGDAAGATNTSAEATESRPTQHIATLYSGRMYREYLRRRGSRLPHYLNLPDDVNNRRQGRRYRRSQEPFVSSMASVAHPPGDTAGSAGLSVEG